RGTYLECGRDPLRNRQLRVRGLEGDRVPRPLPRVDVQGRLPARVRAVRAVPHGRVRLSVLPPADGAPAAPLRRRPPSGVPGGREGGGGAHAQAIPGAPGPPGGAPAAPRGPRQPGEPALPRREGLPRGGPAGVSARLREPHGTVRPRVPDGVESDA